MKKLLILSVLLMPSLILTSTFKNTGKAIISLTPEDGSAQVIVLDGKTVDINSGSYTLTAAHENFYDAQYHFYVPKGNLTIKGGYNAKGKFTGTIKGQARVGFQGTGGCTISCKLEAQVPAHAMRK